MSRTWKPYPGPPKGEALPAELMLIIGEGTYPVGRRRRKVVALHVEVEHSAGLREGRAPGVAHKPRGGLLLGGHQVNETSV